MSADTLRVKSQEDPSDIVAIWNTAIARYEDTTQIKVGSLIEASSVDEILNEIHDRSAKFKNHRHNDSKSDRFRTLVSKSLGPVEKLCEIVSSAASTPFPPSTAIFTAIRHLISVANSVSADYDKVTGFFEDLDMYLNRLKILENRAPPVPELKLAIAEVLTSVLVICGICVKYLKMRRIVKAFQNLLSGEDDELAPHMRISTKRSSKSKGYAIHADIGETLAITARTDQKTNVLISKTERMHECLHVQEVASERTSLLNEISSLSFHKKQGDIFSRHQNGTGQWLLETSEFKQWVKDVENSVLWCHGIPGGGKTVMTSIAINHIKDVTHGTKTGIAYLFCDYKDKNTQSVVELLSSITRQLAEKIEPIPTELSTFYHQYRGKMNSPTKDERISLIRSILSYFEKIFIFVDALDECSETSRESFLHLMKKIKPLVRFFFTSRPNVDLQAKFSGLSCINISATNSDIEAYLESAIKANHRLSIFTDKDPDLRGKILDRLYSRAAGMFLFVHLQVEHLSRQISLKNVHKALDAMPLGVYATYEDTFERIEDQPEEDGQLAKKAFSFIFCARRPLQVEELLHALAIEAGDTELDEAAFPETEILLNVSAGLISVDEVSRTIALVHYTLQEYLEKDSSHLLSEFEFEMAKACLTYLSLDVFGDGPCSDGAILHQRLQSYRFLDYASRHWGFHVIGWQFYERSELLITFLEDDKKLSSFVQVLHVTARRTNDWYSRFPRDFGLLHVVAYWGLDRILNFLFRKDLDVDSQDSCGSTALQLAAKQGHEGITNFLLQKGAKVNIKSGRGETALYWAARYGHKITVELLLKNNANVIEKDCEGWTALDWAVLGGHNEVLRVLLENGVDLNTEDGGRNRALYLAADEGHEITAQMLLDNGADVNAKDKFGSTALDWAVSPGHEATVRVLLRNGANVNSMDEYGNTAVHWAVPHEAILNLLLDNGADVDTKNDSGKGALHWASQDGSEQVIRLLLQKGANVNIQDLYGFTPLHGAALRGRETIVRQLLAHGANTNSKNEDGWKPLHLAALMQHEALVQIFMDKTENGYEILKWMDVQLQDKIKHALLKKKAEEKAEGSTVVTGLRSAVQDGHIGRLQLLLEKGADIDAKDVGGWTALICAAAEGKVEALQLLLEEGAGVNISGRDERTALHWASARGDIKLVQLLVEHGADVDASAYGFTAMLLAAKNGHSAALRYLADKEADIKTEDYQGRTILHWAVNNSLEEMVQYLCDKGANINAIDYWGRTALVWAVDNMQTTIVKNLIAYGADLDMESHDGSTALHWAAFIPDEGMVRQLLDGGAMTEAKTQDGFTALHLAALLGCEPVVQLLLEGGANTEAQARWGDLGYEIDDSENGESGASEGDRVESLTKLHHRLFSLQKLTFVDVDTPHILTPRYLGSIVHQQLSVARSRP